MIQRIKVDLSKLCKAGGMRIHLWKGIFKSDTSNSIEYELVLDDNARFINLFGLCVNVDNGNIAFGVSPNPDRYIKLGNFYDYIRDANTYSYSLASESFLKLKNDDLRFLLEDLKLNPKNLYTNAQDYDLYFSRLINNKDLNMKSLILNLVSDKDNIYNSKRSNKFLNEKCVIHLIENWVNTQLDILSIFSNLFERGLLEKNIKEVWKESETYKLFKSKTSTETRFIAYLEEIPYDFLSAVRSYGFGIKQRSTYLYKILRSTDMNDIIGCGEILSSLSYIDDTYFIPANVKTYNIIDMLRAVGDDGDLFLSLDILLEYKNTSLYRKLDEKYSLSEILQDVGVSKRDFILGVQKYRKRAMLLIDRCGEHTIDVTKGQYSFSSLGERSIINSGRIFEKVSSRILKKF